MIDEAETRVTGMLLLEIVDALMERGALRRGDVAGALLRTEYRAGMADDIAAEEGEGINGLRLGWARLATEEWTRRLGLPPEIYALRQRHEAWVRAASGEPNPLYAEEVAALFDDEDCP